MTSAYQQRFWSMLVETRVHAFYLHHYGSWLERREKWINIFLAVMSSSSIAAWAIWREFTWVWPTLIAISQVVSAVKPFLPYNQQLKTVLRLSDGYQAICLQMENQWYSVSEGLYSEKKIHEETIKFRELLLEAQRKNVESALLPRKQKMLDRAEADSRKYFETHYAIGDSL